MTGRAEIERLLNQTGRTLEGLPKFYPEEQAQALYLEVTGRRELWENILLHQSDVIELLVGALQDSEPKRKYGECYHCKNGTYSCPITQMDRTLIRYSNFCDECGRDLRPVVREMYRREK